MWIFYRTPETNASGCPKCNFAHYGARYVFGKQAYTFAETQKPWYDRKMDRYASELRQQIREGVERPKRSHKKKPNQWQQWLAVRAEIEGRP